MNPKSSMRKVISLLFAFACVVLVTASPQWINELRAQVYGGDDEVDNSIVLTVDKQASTDVAAPGDTISYTVIVSNISNNTAFNVVASDILPAGFTLLSVNATGIVCNGGTCSIGSMVGPSTVQLTFSGTINDDFTGSSLVNSVTVSGTDQDGITVTASDSATVQVQAPMVDLVIDKTASPNPVSSGQTLTYTLQVSNMSQAIATNVTVGDSLPADFQVTSISSSSGSCTSFPCNLGTLAGGGVATITVVGLATGSAGTLTNSAMVSSDQVDANPANNSDSVTVTVTEVPVAAPVATILTPLAGAAGLQVNSPVTFTGSGTSTTGNPLTFAWNFGADANPATSTLQSPGDVTYASAGTRTVTFTVTDTVTGLSAQASLVVTIQSANGGMSTSVSDALQALVQTQPQRDIARTIGVVCPQGAMGTRNVSDDLQRDCNNVVNAGFGGTDPNGAAQAISSITPDFLKSAVDQVQSISLIQSFNVFNRLVAVRDGATGIDYGALAFDIDGQRMTGKHLAAMYKDAMGGAAAAESDGLLDTGRLGVFVSGTLGYGDKDASDNEEGADIDTQGLTLGADYRITDELVFGAAIGYTNTDTELDGDRGDLDTDGYSLTLYGTYFRPDTFFVDGSIGYGRNDHDQSRNIRYNLQSGVSVDQTFDADYDSDPFSLTLGAGYDFSRGGFTYGPRGRVQYIRTEVDGFREEAASNPGLDGSGWGVEIDDETYTSLTLELGGEVSYAWSQPWGVVVPQASVSWVHEFDDDSQFIEGRFLGDTGATNLNPETFRLSTDSPDRNYFNVQVGASAVFTQGRSAFINYRGVFGNDDVDANIVNLGVRLEF